MFSLRHTVEDGFKKIILKNEKTNSRAEILPACGAMLHLFTAGEDPLRLNVVQNYKDYETFQKEVTAGFIGSKLSPFVCRLAYGKYHFAEKDYKVEDFYMGEHAIHGELFNKPFVVQNEKANENCAEVSLLYSYKKDDIGYPFEYDCLVKWTLEDENSLTVSTQIFNKDQGLIPIQDGWHPYFQLEDTIDNLELEFQSDNMVEFDEDLLPTGSLKPYHEFNALRFIGNTFLDNCFTLAMESCQPLCVLRNPAKRIQVEIHPGKEYPYLQIYTPPHRQSIAIENLSSAPDGFNNGMGLKVLEPGQEVLFSTTYKIKMLSSQNER